MACGDKYASMLKTSDGYTPSDPWGLFPTAFVYDDWYGLAHQIGRDVFARWDWLLSIEDKLTKLRDAGEPVPVDGPYPDRDQLLFLLQRFSGNLDGLRHVVAESLVPDGVTWEAAIMKALNVSREGTCVLEQLDAAAEYYQRPPLPSTTKGKPPAAEGGVGGVIFTALALGGAFYYLRHRRAKA